MTFAHFKDVKFELTELTAQQRRALMNIIFRILKRELAKETLNEKVIFNLMQNLEHQNQVYLTLMSEDRNLKSLSGDNEYLIGLRNISITRMYNCVDSLMGTEYAYNKVFSMKLFEELCLKSDLRDYPSFLEYYVRINDQIRDEYLYVERENLLPKFYNTNSCSDIHSNVEDARNYHAEILAFPESSDTKRKVRELAIIYRYLIRELKRRSALDSLYS